MHTLFLDLASHEKIFVIVDEKVVKASATIADRTPESELMPTLESVCTKAGIALAGIQRICSVTGPGGFMSLRVAISFANALSWSLQIPLAGIHLADLWEARATHYSRPTTHYVWLHSTKKDSLFIRGFGDLEKEWPAPSLISIGALMQKLETTSHKLQAFVGELIPEHRAVLPVQEMEAQIRPLQEILPSLVRELTYEKKSLQPWYGRGA